MSLSLSSLTLPLPPYSPFQLDPSRSSQYFNRSSPIDPTNARGASESELLALDFPHLTTTVLNLAGLWGGERNMRNWVSRVAPDKETLRTKGGLHMGEFSRMRG